MTKRDDLLTVGPFSHFIYGIDSFTNMMKTILCFRIITHFPPTSLIIQFFGRTHKCNNVCDRIRMPKLSRVRIETWSRQSTKRFPNSNKTCHSRPIRVFVSWY